MPALSGGDVTALRSNHHTYSAFLAVAENYDIATARINQSTFAKPLAQVTVDDTSARWGDVRQGMTAWVGTTAGARDIGVYRVRETPDASTLYLAQMSSGDSGMLALGTLEALVDNAYITIKLDFNLWAVLSRIVYSGDIGDRTGVFRKDFDEVFANETSTAPDAILNLGSHRIETITSGTASVAFAPSLIAFDSATVSSYSWDVFSESSASFAASTSATPTFNLVAGFHVVQCTATLSNGQVIIAQRCVWVFQDGTYEPFDIQIESDRRDMIGRRMSFTTRDTLGDLYDGVMAVYYEDAEWGGSSITDANTQFVGFVETVQGGGDNLLLERSFELVSPFHIMTNLHISGQQLVVNASPASWQQVSNSNSHLDFWLFYLMRYHTTLLNLFDLSLSGLDNYKSLAWKTDAGNIVDQMNASAERLNCSIGQADNGAIYIRRDPVFLADADRDTLPEVMTITDADLTQPASIPTRLRPRFSKCESDGFVYNGTSLIPLRAAAAGYVGGQGSQIATLQNQLVLSQSELNNRTANALARDNNPFAGVTLVLGGNYDVFVPARREWVRLDLDEAWAIDTINARAVVTSINVRHDANGIKTVELTVDVETSGAGGAGSQTIPVGLPTSGNAGLLFGSPSLELFAFDEFGFPQFNYDPYRPSIQQVTYPEPFALPLPSEVVITQYAVMWGGNGLAVTEDYTADLPTGTFVHTPAGESYEEGDVIVLNENQIVTLTDGGVYKCDNIRDASPTFTKIHTIDDGQHIRANKSGIAVYRPTTVGEWTTEYNFADVSEESPSGDLAEVYTGWALNNQNLGLLTVNGWEDTFASFGGENRRGITLEFFARLSPAYSLGSFTLRGSFTPGSGGSNFIQLTQRVTPLETISSPGALTGDLLTWTSTHPSGFTSSTELNVYVRTDTQTAPTPVTGDATLESFEASGTGFNPFDTVKVDFSADDGATWTTVEAGAQRGDKGYDMDKHGLGVHLIASNNMIYYTTTYTQAVAEPVDKVIENGGVFNIGAPVSFIEIPYQTVGGSLNNNANALEFYYGIDRTGGLPALFRVTFNASTGEATEVVDVTPIINESGYRVVFSPNALGSFDGEAGLLAAFLEGATNEFAISTSAGTQWEAKGDLIRGFEAYFRPPRAGGSGAQIWMNTLESIFNGATYSDDGGDTVRPVADFTNFYGSSLVGMKPL